MRCKRTSAHTVRGGGSARVSSELQILCACKTLLFPEMPFDNLHVLNTCGNHGSHASLVFRHSVHGRPSHGHAARFRGGVTRLT